MNTILRNCLIGMVILLVVVGAYYYISSENARQVKLTTFAKCISGAGAKFYGAFWCVHCQSQKALFQTTFGSAENNLPYVECSTPDSNGQLSVCNDAKIKVYPTWKFADGTIQEGEMSFVQLAAKTGCVVPK